MGLGKTSTVLSALELLTMAGSNLLPALILAPKRVARDVWIAERDKWDQFKDLSIRVMAGLDAADRKESVAVRPWPDIVTLNYENIPWLLEHVGVQNWPFKTVIADESTRLKNFRLMHGGGVRSDALSYIAKRTGRWVNLSGLPAPNGLTDLWGQTWFLDYGERLKRSYEAFKREWFHEDRYSYKVTPQPGSFEAINAKLADITCSLRTEDWFPDLDKPQFNTVLVTLPREARRAYDEMESDYFTQGIEAPHAGAKAQKLLQIADGAIYDEGHTAHVLHDEKLDALEDIVQEAAGEPILIVYYYQFDRERILKRLPKASRIYETERDERDWNRGKILCMLINPRSAAHGMNLQDGGRRIVFYTNTPDLELAEQVLQRIGPVRQAQSGHGRKVLVYHIVADATIDLEVSRMLRDKLTIHQALQLAHARGGI